MKSIQRHLPNSHSFVVHPLALTTQNAFMLDDFTEENGATRIVPGSHKTRKKPRWEKHGAEHLDEVALTGSAGSLALWLSNTWHRHGPNSTDRPRRAVLAYYCRSWIKPFTDFRTVIPAENVQEYSPLARYLMGFSSNPPPLLARISQCATMAQVTSGCKSHPNSCWFGSVATRTMSAGNCRCRSLGDKGPLKAG